MVCLEEHHLVILVDFSRLAVLQGIGIVDRKGLYMTQDSQPPPLPPHPPPPAVVWVMLAVVVVVEVVVVVVIW